MSSIDYKAQARRLQAWLKSHPEEAERLKQGAYSACMEAVAALHGARNWNALQGSTAASSLSPVPVVSEPSATSLDDALNPGLTFVTGPYGGGKSAHVAGKMFEASQAGKSVLILDGGHSFTHFADSMGGVVVTLSALRAMGPGEQAILLAAPFVRVDFEPDAQAERGLNPRSVHEQALPRFPRADVVVIDEGGTVSAKMGDGWHTQVDTWLKGGATLVAVGQQPDSGEMWTASQLAQAFRIQVPSSGNQSATAQSTRKLVEELLREPSTKLTVVCRNNLWQDLLNFILDSGTEEPMAFLRAWYEGNYEACKREWPEAPASLHAPAAVSGADPAAEEVWRELFRFVMEELNDSEARDFLRTWREGRFDACRKWWPEALEVVYSGQQL